MKTPTISPNLTIEDIHALREYNYEATKKLSRTDLFDYYNRIGNELKRKIDMLRTPATPSTTLK